MNRYERKKRPDTKQFPTQLGLKNTKKNNTKKYADVLLLLVGGTEPPVAGCLHWIRRCRNPLLGESTKPPR